MNFLLDRRSLVSSFATVGAFAAISGSRIAAGSVSRRLPLASHDAIRFGTAVRVADIRDQMAAEIISKNFSLLSPEREMKMSLSWKGPKEYDFTQLDEISQFAKKYGMLLRGHTVLWYNSVPKWLSENIPSRRSDLIDLILGYVEQLSRYNLASLDVVNEALADKAATGEPYRPSFWLENLGSEYISQIFKLTAERLPTVPLIYNDYNLEFGGQKQKAALELCRSLVEADVPISGIGLQSHLFASPHAAYPSLPSFLKAISELGLDIYVTELDVSCSHLPKDMQAEQIDAIVKKTTEAYLACFQDIRPPRELVTWGFWDKHTYLNIAGNRWQRPLPFDAEGRPKSMLATLQSFVRR